MGKKTTTQEEQRHYFRLQYHKGEYLISENVEGRGYLPIRKMIEITLRFVIKVKNEVGEEIGGKVALQGLKLICKLCTQVEMDWIGNGQSVSHFLDLNNAKNSVDRSERFDVEFLGIGGRDDKQCEEISKFIKAYKEIVRRKR